MKAPTVVSNAICPCCSGSEWKLAKMFLLEGMVNVETRTTTIGTTATTIAHEYDHSTTGTHTRADAIAFAPPLPPKEYEVKDLCLLMGRELTPQHLSRFKPHLHYRDYMFMGNTIHINLTICN